MSDQKGPKKKQKQNDKDKTTRRWGKIIGEHSNSRNNIVYDDESDGEEVDL